MAAVYQQKIKYDQYKIGMVSVLDVKRPVSCSLEDKHVVNEHHVVLKRHDATHDVTRDCLKQTQGIKNVTLKATEKFLLVAVYWEE